jgi:hypothetical protein
MSTSLPPVRRIVTGIDANGRSYIAEDGVSPAMFAFDGRPGFRSNNIWRTSSSPASVGAGDSVLEHRGLLPPKSGTLLRVIDIPPEDKDPEVRKRAAEAVFAAIYPDVKHNAANSRHPGMHITDTIDYAIVLQGELIAIMDEGETVMRAGDILIQRGTNHAWANRSGAIARIAFILVDGSR